MIAASQNHPDVVEHARHLLGRIYWMVDKPQKALEQFQIALKKARQFGMRFLEAKVLLAKANVQLTWVTSPRRVALEGLKLANENVLVVCQIEALVIIGTSYQVEGNQLGLDYFRVARDLARQSERRLLERKAEQALSMTREEENRFLSPRQYLQT